LIQEIRHTMHAKLTEELIEIYRHHNAEAYSAEAFEAIRQVLLTRGEAIPAIAPTKQCPHCGLRSHETVLQCDCGYHFQSGQGMSQNGGMEAPAQYSLPRELKQRVFRTVVLLLITQILHYIPFPGAWLLLVQYRYSVASLGLTPYLNASIL